jgi:hypothetical protein
VHGAAKGAATAEAEAKQGDHRENKANKLQDCRGLASLIRKLEIQPSGGQGRARQSKTEQGRARQSKAEQGRARLSMAEQGRARQSKAEQGRARQSKAEQGKSRQIKAEHG